jgi:hypothetical protein
VYTITKALTGGVVNSTTVVKDKNGHILMKNENQLERWAELFQEVLNRPDPKEEAKGENTDFYIEMKRGRVTQEEIEEAITQTKGEQGTWGRQDNSRYVES